MRKILLHGMSYLSGMISSVLVALDECTKLVRRLGKQFRRLGTVLGECHPSVAQSAENSGKREENFHALTCKVGFDLGEGNAEAVVPD